LVFISETEHFKRIVNTLKFVYISSPLVPRNDSFNINSLFILNELEKCFEYLQTDPTEIDWNLIANNNGDKSTSPFKNFIYSPVKVQYVFLSSRGLIAFFLFRNNPMWMREATCLIRPLYTCVFLIWMSSQACSKNSIHSFFQLRLDSRRFVLRLQPQKYPWLKRLHQCGRKMLRRASSCCITGSFGSIPR